MHVTRVFITASFGLTALLNFSCIGDRGPVPETASSAGSVTYAEEFGERLDAVHSRYGEISKLARTDAETFESFPDELGEPDWLLVEELIAQADAAGRSHGVIETFDRARMVRETLDDHGKAVSRRVSAHVNAVLKSRSCDCEFPTGLGTGRAVADAVDRELRDRYRELNEAHALLVQRADDLDEADVNALEEQIDTVSETSFFVRVDAPRLRDEIDRLLDDAEQVDQTLVKAIAAERTAADADGATKRRQKVARARIEELEAARAPVEGAVEEAATLREGMDDDILSLRAMYDDALGQLLDAVRSRQD